MATLPFTTPASGTTQPSPKIWYDLFVKLYLYYHNQIFENKLFKSYKSNGAESAPCIARIQQQLILLVFYNMWSKIIEKALTWQLVELLKTKYFSLKVLLILPNSDRLF